MLSRVADSLYWMSRYLERAEHTARLTDLNLVLMLDQSPAFRTLRWSRPLQSLGIVHETNKEPDVQELVGLLVWDKSQQSSIISSLGAARDNARQVREHLSSEMWEHLNQLYLQVSRTRSSDVWQIGPHPFLRSIKEGSHLFQGITDSTISRGEGWHFIQLGRFMERTNATAALLETYFGPRDEMEGKPEGVANYLDWVGLLKSCTAFEAYCQVYTADLQAQLIAEFLLLNPEFPHTVQYGARMVEAALRAIARTTGAHNSEQATRLGGRLRATLEYAQIDEIMTGDIAAFLADIQRQCAHLHRTIHQIYFEPPLESVLP